MLYRMKIAPWHVFIAVYGSGLTTITSDFMAVFLCALCASVVKICIA